MTIWIVRFIPHGGAINHDLTFRNEGAAKVVFEHATAHQESDGKITLESEFGIKVNLNPALCDIVFTGSETSAAVQAALNDANFDAARLYGLPQGQLNPGSTVQ